MSLRNQQAQTMPTITPVLNMGPGTLESVFKDMTKEDLKALLELLDDARLREHFSRLVFKLNGLYLGLSSLEGNNAEALEFNRTQVFTVISFLKAWNDAAVQHREGIYALTQPLPESSEQF